MYFKYFLRTLYAAIASYMLVYVFSTIVVVELKAPYIVAGMIGILLAYPKTGKIWNILQESYGVNREIPLKSIWGELQDCSEDKGESISIFIGASAKGLTLTKKYWLSVPNETAFIPWDSIKNPRIKKNSKYTVGTYSMFMAFELTEFYPSLEVSWSSELEQIRQIHHAD